jgi:hypothetical protein
MISQTETVKKYTCLMTVLTAVITVATLWPAFMALWDHLPAFHTLPPPASLPDRQSYRPAIHRCGETMELLDLQPPDFGVCSTGI